MTDTVQVVEIRLDAIKDPAIFRAMLVPEGETAPALQAQAARTGYAAWGPGGTLIAATVPVIATSDGSITSVTTTSAMAALSGPVVGALVFLVDGDRSGAFETKAGNVPAGDPLQGLTIQSAAGAFHYARQWDGINGRPEWFGAVAGDGGFDNKAAIEACHALCPVTQLGAFDYFVADTLVISDSYKTVMGCYGSADISAGTRIILTGSAVATKPVIQVGNLANDIVSNCSRRIHVYGVNAVRDGAVTPPSSEQRQDAVAGWRIEGLYESLIERCWSKDSATGWRVVNTVSCELRDTGYVRSTTGTVNGHPDLSTGYCLGGYSPAFGASVGANWSLRVTRALCAGAVGSATVALYLFGAIADTWVDRLESAGMDHGCYIDGSDAFGTALTGEANHQDVFVTNLVADACNVEPITIRNINSGGMVTLANPYAATSNPSTGTNGIAIDTAVGMVCISGGQIISNVAIANVGALVINSTLTRISGTQFKNFDQSVVGDNSHMMRLEPMVARTNSGGLCGVDLLGCTRSYIAPQIGGLSGSLTNGIIADAATANCETNLTAIDIGVLSSGLAADKLIYNGAAVSTATYGTGNVRSGVTS